MPLPVLLSRAAACRCSAPLATATLPLLTRTRATLARSACVIAMHAWVHSSVARAADCRSAGPWFKSGCALVLRHAPREAGVSTRSGLGSGTACLCPSCCRVLLHAPSLHPWPLQGCGSLAVLVLRCAHCTCAITMHAWVHSSVARAADCRSAGPWFESGCVPRTFNLLREALHDSAGPQRTHTCI